MNEIEQKAEECYMAYLESNLGTSPKAIKKLLVTFAEQETKLLSEHIRELQKDKGKLIDENKEYESEAREVNIRFDNVIKQLAEAREIISDLIELGKIWLEESDDDYEFIKRAEQFLGDEREMSEEWFYVSDKIPNEESMLLLARKTVNNNKQALIGYYKNGKFERFNERTGLMETIDSVYAWKFIDLPEIKE